MEFLCSINSHNTIDVLSLILFWLKLGQRISPLFSACFYLTQSAQIFGVKTSHITNTSESGKFPDVVHLTAFKIVLLVSQDRGKVNISQPGTLFWQHYSQIPNIWNWCLVCWTALTFTTCLNRTRTWRRLSSHTSSPGITQVRFRAYSWWNVSVAPYHDTSGEEITSRDMNITSRHVIWIWYDVTWYKCNITSGDMTLLEIARQYGRFFHATPHKVWVDLK